jgi:putative glutamine amidotransferase
VRPDVTRRDRDGAATGPLIGVAGEDALVLRPWGEQLRTSTPTAVVDRITAAGGLPVVLPPGAGAAHLARLDGLVLTGGADLGTDPGRDVGELGLVHLARHRGLPLLGLCRGLQVMAVATGGSLVEDLGESHLVLPPATGTHPLLVEPGSLADALVPDRRASSLHHQSVATYDAGWRCTARAPDGVVEVLEWRDQDAWLALGVQWHPEIDHTGPAVFGWLVQAAQSPSRTRTIPVSVGT